MTGYGKATFSIEGFSVLIEIRSLNSKQFDLNTRIALPFRDKENEIRTLVNHQLSRGKIDLAISIEKRENSSVTLNMELAKQYLELFSQMARECDIAITADLLVQAIKMPDVALNTKEEISDNLWRQLIHGIGYACDAVNEFRQSEGSALEKDIINRVKLINCLIDEITPLEKKRIETIRTKFESELEDINVEYDRNRLEEELIYYIEKLDITEEKVRLRKHCEFFLETARGHDESLGKKLGFILQEFGREINTLGSKANDFQIQQIVVNMKDELEKIKEQLANIL
jgi:uncharacterized protein (TIGR00255 family)